MKKVVVLISGSGSNLQAIMDNCQAGKIDGEVVAVISNKADAYGLVRAKNAGIDALVLSHKGFPSRESFDQALAEKIDLYQPDYIVLAGFMRILSDSFVERYHGKMINIHPSLLPKYKGLNTHQRAIEAGDKEHGASVHFVTPALDDGPVIIQSAVAIEAGDDAGSLQQKVHRIEHIIYPQALVWLCSGQVKLQGRTVLLDGSPLPEQGNRYEIS